MILEADQSAAEVQLVSEAHGSKMTQRVRRVQASTVRDPLGWQMLLVS